MKNAENVKAVKEVAKEAKSSKFFTGLVIGAAVSAVTVAAVKVAKEIKGDVTKLDFASPDGQNLVGVELGSSSFAKGLTLIKIKAENSLGTDECKFVFLAGSKDITCEWKDENNCEILAGKGKIKHFCTVCFEGGKIVLVYSFKGEEKEKEYVKVEIEKGETK